MSYLDIMKDLQLLQSVLTRQLLDNIYKMNVRKKFISEDSLTEDGATMEALLNTQAEFVPVRGMAGNAVFPEQPTSIIGEILPVIQHVEQQRASRTGVTPESQVDPNALQEVRQEVFSSAMDRASQRIEMLVRIFAETGYRWLMKKTHQLLRSHWDIRKTVKLRGQWVPVDPQGWRDRTDMTVNVGLGFHSKQQQLQMLSQMLSVQQEAAGQGLTDPRKIYNTLEKLVSAAGLGDGRMYFTSPEDPNFQPPEPQPDPATILAQAQAQALQTDSQTKQQQAQTKAQHDEQKLQADAQKAQAEIAIKQAELQAKQVEMELKQRELALRELELEAEGRLKEGELAAKIENMAADTQLKMASADKAMADAAATAVEASDAFKEAQEMVAQGAELNEQEGAEYVEDTGNEDEG